MLLEYRKAQIQKAGAVGPTTLVELDAKFRQMDSWMSMVPYAGTPTGLEETMISADFTLAIQGFVQRQMVPGYTQVGFAFEPFVKPDTTPNFLPVTRLQKRAGVDDLEYVGEKGEARPGSVDDAHQAQYRVYRMEKQFDFSMENLINDDLGYFQDQAADMGRAARRTLEKYVSRFMWNAVTVARLIALGALFSTTGRLTTARISTARMAFSQRTDARGERITAPLTFLVYHTGLADTVAQIQASELVPELATNARNTIRGTFTPIEDPYCAGVAPNLPWFAMTNWGQTGVVPFILARRAGMPGPMLLRKKSDIESITTLLGGGADVPPVMGDFATANIVVKVIDQWGTYIDGTEGNMFDNRGCYYSTGTAP